MGSMPKPRSYGGTFQDMPAAIQRAANVDRGWYGDAKCPDHLRDQPLNAINPWTVDLPRPSHPDRAKMEAYATLALTVCRGCDAQWDCARTAIEAGEAAGRWGATLDDLRFLESQPDWRTKLEMARGAVVPVQTLISQLRRLSCRP